MFYQSLTMNTRIDTDNYTGRSCLPECVHPAGFAVMMSHGFEVAEGWEILHGSYMQFRGKHGT